MKSMKREKIILNLSTWSGGLIAVIELVMAWYSSSQAVLMDGIFDSSEVLVSAAFLIMLPFIYKKETEKMPYGYAQLESIFILIKGSMLTVITINLIYENIQIILQGGNQVDSMLIGIFELAVCIFSIFVLGLISRINHEVNSQVVKAEIISWKIDAACCFGVSAAFLVQIFLKNTVFFWMGKYIDQIVAIIIAVIMLPQPMKMVWESLKSIILIAPGEEIVTMIKKIVNDELLETPYQVTFYDIVQTGRKIWVNIYIKSEDDIVYINQIKMLREKMKKRLQIQIADISVEITPDLD